MTQAQLSIDFERLRNDIEALAVIGRQADLGIYRMAFSDGDWAAREWLIDRIHAAGLELYIDDAANIHARLGWDEMRSSVITGSHLDTVPNGGHLDGALGVLAGLECLRSIKEQTPKTRLPLEAIAFTDEEGRFGGMLGSQAFCGRLTPQCIHAAIDLSGVTLETAMRERGLDASLILRASRPPASVEAFVELHIEQGPVLDSQGISIGVIEAITGLLRWKGVLIGRADHAGTTPMNMRKDALQGLAEFAGEIPRILKQNGGARSYATIGCVECFPGASNVVPGKVEFSFECRETNEIILAELARAFKHALSDIARRRDLMCEFTLISEIAPVKCDPGVLQTIEEVTRAERIKTLRMASGAAHDTQMMATITRAGMIFVPSREGRSHSAAEWTAWEDIETGANVLLNTLYRLAS